MSPAQCAGGVKLGTVSWVFVQLEKAKEKRCHGRNHILTVVDNPDCCLSFEFVANFVQVCLWC